LDYNVPFFHAVCLVSGSLCSKEHHNLVYRCDNGIQILVTDELKETRPSFVGPRLQVQHIHSSVIIIINRYY